MANLLVVTEWSPPIVEGGPIILGKILKHISSEEYCVFTADFRYHRSKIDYANKLSCRYYLFKPWVFPVLIKSGMVNLINSLFLFFSLPAIVIRGLIIVRKENISTILGISNCGPFLIASYLISRLTHREFHVYLLDAYMDLLTSRWQKFIAKVFEPKILGAAKKVLVMSETLQELYWQRYRIKATVIPHPVNLESYCPGNNKLEASAGNDEVEIVYTGVVYSPQYDGINNMVKAVNDFGSEIRFSIYTPQDKSVIQALGIEGKNTQIKYVPHTKIAEVQKRAKILFLPISFRKDYFILVNTAAPSKMPEYLASGVPILVNAPGYAYVAYFFKKHNCGLVVVENDAGKLKEGIKMLLNDKDIVDYFVNNALKTAMKHDEKKVAEKFVNLLGLKGLNYESAINSSAMEKTV